MKSRHNNKHIEILTGHGMTFSKAAAHNLVLVFVLLIFTASRNPATAMTWANTWKDILNGGASRWKVDDVGLKRKALSQIVAYASKHGSSSKTLDILCPLAGDDPFVHHAWEEGHSVTSIDIVPEAVAAMRWLFGPNEEDWSTEKTSSSTVWKHKSGRATLYEGDMMEQRPELHRKFDAIYDKDSFGALDPEMRQRFCDCLANCTKDGAVVYLEVKFKDPDSPGRYTGPPYHLEKNDLMSEDCFGRYFDYECGLGEVYDLPMDGLAQTGHILRRIGRDSAQD